jgi:hypothetical protein
MDELMKLWKLGIPTLNYSKLENSHGFLLCSLVLWTINDFPRYGLLSRCVHRLGYVTCPLCGPQTTSQHSCNLSKVVYMGHHKWLKHRHWHTPKFLDGLNYEFEGENIIKKRSWNALRNSQHFRDRGACWSFGMRLGRVTSKSIIHMDMHKLNNKLVTA